MAIVLPIHVDEQALADLASRFHVASISLFGSALRDDFGPASDIDVLVEFSPGKAADYFTLAEMESELASMFGRKTEVFTLADLSPHFRDGVLRTALRLYDAPR